MILQILDKISSISSTNSKLEELSKNSENQILREVFKLAYDPTIKYWIKKIPETEIEGTKELQFALDKLVVLYTRIKTGNEAIEFLRELLSSLNKRDQEVLSRIISRDLRCGIATKQINKIWKGMIREYPVMLCDKFDAKTEKNINFENAQISLKMDGSRINLEFDQGKCISVTTRNGNSVEIDTFNDIELSDKSNFILDGELLYAPDGIISDRKEGNGFVTKAVRGTITQEESKNLIFVGWDYIPKKDFEERICKLKLRERFELLQQAIQNQTKLILVEYEPAISKEHTLKVFDDYLKKGEEGIILKNLDSFWEAKRSKFSLKLKAELTCELECIGIEYGSGKYEAEIGSLFCASRDNKLFVNVGSGLTDEDRKLEKDFYIGKIIEVKYNEVIENKTDDKKSLFLPIFKGIRYDKNEANSIGEIE